MIIIIEGVDRVGKTTLCNKLSRKFNIPIHKYKGIISYDNMHNDEETDKTLGLIQLIKETNANIIFDRSYISDYVYGILQRGYDIANAFKNFKLVNDALYNYSLQGKVYIILVKSTDIKKSSLEHGKDLQEHEYLFCDAYNLIDENLVNKICCDYNTIDAVLNIIKGE